jgi:VWFA-related protein
MRRGRKLQAAGQQPVRLPGTFGRAGFALACAAALGVMTAAQQPVPADQPAFRTGADLVIVDAVVVDRAGKPVTGLTAADFEVRDEGRPQAVSLFQTVAVDAPPVRAAAASRYRYSTNAGVDAVPGRAFVLFFDDVHLTQAEGDRAKTALTRFLERELQPGDLVSLVAPGNALRWHARMPDGRPELMRVVAGLRGLYLPDPSPDTMSDYEAYRINAFSDEAVADQVDRRWRNQRVNGREPENLATSQGFRPENRGGQIGIIAQDILMRAASLYQQAAARNIATLQALERTIDGLSAVRGRKAVIMLSPGFVADQERLEAKRATEAARRANVAVYFVDARGLVSSVGSAQAQQTGRPLDSRDIGAANAEITLGAEGAAEIASNTGGFSVRNQNDLGRGLQRIGDESRVYYLLGFQPNRDARPGVFRRLEVKVTRPDVTVRARRGYYPGGVGGPEGSPVTGGAAATSTPPRFTDGVDAIDRAAESPYELGAIPLRVADLSFADAATDKASVMLVVEADLRAFEFARAGGKLTDVLDLRMLTTELGTNTTERYERKVEMSFPDTTRFGPDSWHPLAQEFHLKPGRYQARVAIRDASSGRIGSVTHDFEVPPLTGLRFTTPILTDAIEAPSFGSQAPPKPVLIARRTFPAGATLYYQFSVLGAGKDASGATRVLGSHQLLGPGGTVVKQLAPGAIAASGGTPSRFAGLGLAGLPPGDYELVLKVTDEIGGQTIERREPLAIVPAASGLPSADRQP